MKKPMDLFDGRVGRVLGNFDRRDLIEFRKCVPNIRRIC